MQALAPDWVTVRVTLKTAPLKQWGVAREMRERIKARFDHEGIAMQVPQRLVLAARAAGASQTPARRPAA